VHRIGRTGRAGASGIAISFCDAEERPFLRDITKLISISIPVVEEHPFKMAYANFAPSAASVAPAPSRGHGVFARRGRSWRQ